MGDPGKTVQTSLSATQAGTLAPANTASASGGDVPLDFADTDIRTVVTQILGNLLKLDYTIDPSVHGSVTLHSTSPLTREQLLATLQALLAQNGAALIQSGSLYRVVPEAASTTAAGSTVVLLRFTSAEGLARTLQPLTPAETRCWSAATRPSATRW
jgi:general secretion pathway protein D